MWKYYCIRNILLEQIFILGSLTGHLEKLIKP